MVTDLLAHLLGLQGKGSPTKQLYFKASASYLALVSLMSGKIPEAGGSPVPLAISKDLSLRGLSA